MQRPTGVTILAIVDFLGGAISLVMSGLTMAASWWLITETEESSDNVSSVVTMDLAFRGNLMFWVGLLRMGASLSKLVAAVGLWWRKPWGWQLALISGLLKLGTHLVAALRGAISPSAVLHLLVDSAVVVYLCTPRVRRQLSGVSINAPQTTA
jgi:uncharacterized membrane protein (DUF2068 family)